MKKIFIILPMLFAAMAAFGQQDNGVRANSFFNHLMCRLEAGVTTNNKGFGQYTFSGKLGYEVLPRLSAFAMYEGQTGLYDKDDVESITHSQVVGGGLNYLLWGATGRNGDNISLEVQALMGASVGNSDLSQTVYQAGVALRFGTGRIAPTLGLAFRHASMHTAGASNYNGLLATIGFGF